MSKPIREFWLINTLYWEDHKLVAFDTPNGEGNKHWNKYAIHVREVVEINWPKIWHELGAWLDTYRSDSSEAYRDKLKELVEQALKGGD